MSIHVFGSIITSPGIAANNRGETEGNITTLQKLLWKGQVHTTVSSEALRWAIRFYWQNQGMDVNRKWNMEKDDHEWIDPSWSGWTKKDEKKTYIDDDVLGYMKAEGAKVEGEKGGATKRRGILELARAISTTPFVGDITFNSKSGEKSNTSLYGTEVHATRYQYGFAMTPEYLDQKERVLDVIDAIVNLGEVAGNHGRFLFDFSPETVIFRVTEDPAPRLLYCFEEMQNGEITISDLIRRIESKDIKPEELYIGGPVANLASLKKFDGINLFTGVKAAAEAVRNRLIKDMSIQVREESIA
jgi:CRISPR-associated protein Cst2